jgi:ABC-type glycerol-3-phosphate transport system permease component
MTVRLPLAIRIPILALCSILACITVYPVVFMLLNTFRTSIEYMSAPLGLPQSLYLKNYVNMMRSYKVARHLINSGICTGGSLLLILLLSSMAAFSFTKLPFRGNKQVFLLYVSMMMMSPMVLLIPFYLVLARLHLTNSYQGLIIAYAVMCIPYTTYFLRVSYSAVPDELIQAAKVDGAGYLRIFIHIMVPLSSTTLFTLALLNFVWNWNELLYGLVIMQDEIMRTMPAAVAIIVGRYITNMPLLMTGLFLTSLPVLICFFVFQKYLVQGMMVGAIK